MASLPQTLPRNPGGAAEPLFERLAAIASTFVSRDREEDDREDDTDRDELLEILRRIERRLDALDAK